MINLHRQMNLKLLSERRKLFMLIFMYTLSMNEENVNNNQPEMLLCTGPAVKMKIVY